MSMKKNFLYPMMALCMMLFTASCSQEEVVTDSSRPEITTMNVNIPGNGDVNTRAMPTIPEGYKLRCLMQVVDATGTAIQGNEYKQALAVPAEGSLTFSFTTPAAGYKVLFWADYIPQETAELTADHLYATTDLTQGISYVESKLEDGSLFNNAAADAFFGKAEDGNSSVTLIRPFSRLNIKPASEVAEEYSSYNWITVEMKVPAGINILTGAALATTKTIKYNGATQDKYWFNNFVFTGNTTANLGEGNDIKIVFTKEGETADTKTVTIAGEDVTTVENAHINVNVKPIDGSQSSVTVTFPEDLIDPNAPKPLAIGDYIYADGTNGIDPNNAVAIVFAMGAQGGDIIGNYENADGKEIAGYAFAINTTSRTRLTASNDSEGTTLNTWLKGSVEGQSLFSSEKYGITTSDAFLKLFTDNSYTSPLIDEFKTWTDVIPNTSKWYIPTASQLKDIAGLLFNTGDETTFKTSNKTTNPKYPGQNTTIRAAYDSVKGEKAFSGNTGNAGFLLTVDLVSDANGPLVVVQTNESVTPMTVGTRVNSTECSLIIRPVITLFK